jgi:hypothetical protein
MRDLRYVIDARDRLVEVGPGWDAFAEANGAPELVAEKVVGRPLPSFVDDSTTRALYAHLLDRIRTDGRPVCVWLRCDAPTVRRCLELTMSRLDRGHVEFYSRLVREEARPAVDLLDCQVARSSECLTICAWCKRVPTPGGWREIEDAVAALRLFEQAALPVLSHGMCPECRGRLVGELMAEPGAEAGALA